MKTTRTIVLAVVMAAAFAIVTRAQYSGPEKLGPTNYKQPRSSDNSIAFFYANHREWLRLSGDADAPDLSQQWRPEAIWIETKREPVVIVTKEGWEIRFK
jgi:hypothetical protein